MGKPIQYRAMTNMILDSLNDAQCSAVTAPLSHQLILAGAGSGKTRVLVHRFAWLVDVEAIPLQSILAVTFTNKAANEMRSRIEHFLHVSSRALWIGTFHGIAHRLLRLHWREAGLVEGFQILDSDDQLRFIRRVHVSLNLDEERWPAKQSQWFINGKKDEGLEPQHLSAYGKKEDQVRITIYQAYQEACARAGVVDFADLLLKVHQLWLKQPDILAIYQQQFRCILVDEFQDTNTIQYAWVRLLAGQHNFVSVVGDDDQSIYGWRGAKIENIHRFCQDFPAVETVRLEQNYRSTGMILAAANSLISQNTGRLGKNLWTSGAQGDPVTIYAGFNDWDEARFVVNSIRELQIPFSEVGILYRSNAQSRVIEEVLMQFNIPYHVYGGLRFFERAEIKDALGYLRLIANRDDDAAFERVVNTPTRGIGDRTLVALREYAVAQSVSLWRASIALLEQNHFPARAAHALSHFINWMDTIARDSEPLPLYEQTEYVIQNSGLVEHYRKEKGEKGLARIENLEELVNAARQFDLSEAIEGLSPLNAFLASSALEAGDRQTADSANSVQLMTMHAAKGLEFPVVFLCGCEEGIFPHYRSQDNPNQLEEERRLCYVGMTRAMKKLYITYAESRRLHGKETHHRPSRFLREISPEFCKEARMKTTVSLGVMNRPINKMPEDIKGIQIGQHVSHHVFGKGIVLQHEGHNEHARIQVRFETSGTKWLIASFVTAV